MSQPPQFGKRQTCSGGTELVAWAQCSGEEAALCQAQEARDREAAICQQRAKAKGTEGQNAIRDVVGGLNKAEIAYKKARGINDFLNDPIKYLTKTLSPFPNAIDILYANQATHDQSDFDINLGFQLYHYEYLLANKGASTTADPVISFIQKSALQHLDSQYRNTLSQLETLSADIADFQVTPYKQRTPKIEVPRGYTPESSACKVIGTC